MRTGKRLTAFILALTLLLAACSSKTAAATMHLRQTQGTVGVSDSKGQELEPTAGLGLYSGYEVGTQSKSYAWVDLDEVKLTKLDENSEIEILKEDKHLTIEVKSGALFFNVTEPLEEDEAMDIRSSSMMVGIRGTCGWVEVSEDGTTMTLWLLEGTVECSVGDNAVTVRAGEKAVMTTGGEIEVTAFTVQEIPDFVRVELLADEDLSEAVQEASGLDVRDIPEEGPEEDQEDGDAAAAALAQYRAIVEQASSYYGTEATGRYRYALVQLKAADTVPTLLLEAEATDGLYHALMFQYDPASDTVDRDETGLVENVTAGGAYLSRFGLAQNREGIYTIETAAASNSAVIYAREMHVNAFMWQGSASAIPEEYAITAIPWYYIDNTVPLDGWTPGEVLPGDFEDLGDAGDAGDTGDTGDAGDVGDAEDDDGTGHAETPEPPAETGTELPTDGDRIVFYGTLGTYSADEVIAMQGITGAEADYYRSSGPSTYYLIVLDTPQNMRLNTFSGDGMRSGTVTMIALSGLGDLAPYAGQRVIFSMNASQTFWPSDASLPAGQPYTRDVRVLS